MVITLAKTSRMSAGYVMLNNVCRAMVITFAKTSRMSAEHATKRNAFAAAHLTGSVNKRSLVVGAIRVSV